MSRRDEREETRSLMTYVARGLRERDTVTERLLWRELRGSRLGVRIWRQFVIGPSFFTKLVYQGL